MAKPWQRFPFVPPTWLAESAVPASRLPVERLRLAALPTPLQELALPDAVIDSIAQSYVDAGVVHEATPAPPPPSSPPSSSSSKKFSLFIKRDDETGCVLGGNKIRKLEFILAEALRQQKRALVTIGGVQSNHCRITAAAARLVGLEPHLVLRVDAADAADADALDEASTVAATTLRGNALLDRMLGAHVHLVTRADYTRIGQHALVEALRVRLAASGVDAFTTPVGGSDTLGAFGYVCAIDELRTQLAALGVDAPSDIVVAAGSGGTLEGLALGVHLSGMATKVHGVCVCDSPDYFYDHADRVFASLGLDAAGVRARDIMSIVAFSAGAGYGRAQAHERSAQVAVAHATGVLTDPTYTGKAIGALCYLLRHDPHRFRGERVVFWHTGGLFGVFGREHDEHAATHEAHAARVNRFDVAGIDADK